MMTWTMSNFPKIQMKLAEICMENIIVICHLMNRTDLVDELTGGLQHYKERMTPYTELHR